MRLILTAMIAFAALVAGNLTASTRAEAASQHAKHRCGPAHTCKANKYARKHAKAHKNRSVAYRSKSARRSARAKSTGGYSGMASWYGGKFHGRKTASGERYNQNALTAAHRTLPFGTKVRVTSSSGRSVVVRINDRGPFIAGRVIDLSRAAASTLGINGVGRVKLTVLN